MMLKYSHLYAIGKHLLMCLGIFSFFLFFRKPICNVLNKLVVDPFLKDFATDRYSLITLSMTAVVPIFFLFKKIIFNRLYPSLVSIVNVFTIFCVYFFILRDNDLFHAARISLDDQLRYADLIFPTIIYLGLNFKSYRKLSNDPTKEQFVEDDAFSVLGEDAFARAGFAKKIAEIISNSTSKRAFAISIVGSWGSGKSVFMKLIEQELDDSNEILHFNPWKISDLKTVFEDFFRSLSHKVGKYDVAAARELRDYADYIVEIDDNIISKILKQSLKLSQANQSLAEKFDKLNNSIQQTGKRYVVFIDDIDRLTGPEVIQVLKMIRNTADFGNVFFVVAVDYSYVVQSMVNSKEIALESQYLQKIFQFELVLPPIKKDFIADGFKRLMGFNEMPPYEKEEFELVISHIIFNRNDLAVQLFPGLKFEGLLEIVVDNFRDLIRLTNSLKISYRILKGEVDLFDLVVIEMVKLKSITTYNFIGSFQILKEVDNTYPRLVEIDQEKFKQFVGNSETDVEIGKVKRLLDELFGTPKKFLQTSRSINYPKNVEIYFHYQLFDEIPLKEFRDLRKQTISEILEKVKSWEAEGKGAAITQLLQEMRDFESWDEFKKFIHLFLILGNSPRERAWLTYAYGYFSTNQGIINLFTVSDTADVSPEKIEAFLDELFLETDISEYAKSEFASFFLEEYRKGGKFPFKEKSYWLSKTNDALAAYLAQVKEFTPSVYELFTNSIDEIDPDSRNVVINRKATRLVRAFIIKHPDSYLKFVLRPYFSLPSELWVYDPFIDQIFNSFEEFEQLLSVSTSQDDEIIIARKYLPEYKESKAQVKTVTLDKRDLQTMMKARGFDK